MAIVELIFPLVKKDPAILEELEKDWPTLSRGLTHPNPGILRAFRGWVVTENGEDVRDAYREFLLFEWDAVGSFRAFVGSEQFAAFAGSIKHLVTGPPTLQLYEVNLPPKDAASAHIVEIIRVGISSSENVDASLQVWEKIHRFLLSEEGRQACATYGTSMNLEETTVVGIIGWKNLEDRTRASRNRKFLDPFDALKSFGLVSRIIVDVDEMEI